MVVVTRPLSGSVNLNTDISTLVQSSSCPPSLTQSASTLHGINLCSLCFFPSDTLILATHLFLLLSTSQIVSAPSKFQISSSPLWASRLQRACPKSYHCWYFFLKYMCVNPVTTFGRYSERKMRTMSMRAENLINSDWKKSVSFAKANSRTLVLWLHWRKTCSLPIVFVWLLGEGQRSQFLYALWQNGTNDKKQRQQWRLLNLKAKLGCRQKYIYFEDKVKNFK